MRKNQYDGFGMCSLISALIRKSEDYNGAMKIEGGLNKFGWRQLRKIH